MNREIDLKDTWYGNIGEDCLICNNPAQFKDKNSMLSFCEKCVMTLRNKVILSCMNCNNMDMLGKTAKVQERIDALKKDNYAVYDILGFTLIIFDHCPFCESVK
jgi:hypothetical protein